tara:strand:+ start:877 stop:1113 length:237 start_codon:yes stop_codon:yes gene_type:complete
MKKISKSLFADNDERPDCCTTEEWKNRFRISAKLGQINYRSAFIFFTRNGWSWSSGINNLIATHPEIQQIQQELQNDA